MERLNALTQNVLVSRFRSYYLESSLEPPPGLDSREWGFLFFDDSGMRRHKSFFSRGELVDYVRPWFPVMSTTPPPITSARVRRP